MDHKKQQPNKQHRSIPSKQKKKKKDLGTNSCLFPQDIFEAMVAYKFLSIVVTY